MLRIIFRFVGGGLGEKISNEKNEKWDTRWKCVQVRGRGLKKEIQNGRIIIWKYDQVRGRGLGRKDILI